MAKKRVLIVDDDVNIRTVLREYLEEAGLEVTEAGDASTALTLVGISRPDLVVTDVMMPGFGNGLDALKTLRKDPATNSLPVIVLSGSTAAAKLETSAESGKTWVFTKPPNWPALIQAILKVLA